MIRTAKADDFARALFNWTKLGLFCLAMLATCVAGLFVGQGALAQNSNPEIAGVAKYIPDGDTIVLRDGQSIRLLGIDAPETAHNAGSGQHWAVEARDRLRKLAGKSVLRIVPGQTSRDRYGRILALVYGPDGTMFNEALLREGCAFYYPHQDQPSDKTARFLSLQQQAVKSRRGAWAAVLSTPEAAKSYVGNRNSLRFFPVKSRDAGQISQKNRVLFKNLEHAFLAGYAPARAVTPWPSVEK